jgi:hypothetical protein
MKKLPWVSVFSLLVFVTGYILTVHKYPGYEFQYAWLLIASLLSIRLVELRLTKVLSFDIALWICGLVFFLSYYLKFFFTSITPNIVVEMGFLPRLWHWGEFDWPGTQIASLALCTIGIASWALTVFLTPSPTGLRAHSKTITVLPYYLFTMLVLAAGLSIAVAWAGFTYDIGLMGKKISNVLPLHFRGIVFYTSKYFLPGLILMIIYLAYKSKSYLLIFLGVLLLISNALVSLAITSSKGSVLGVILMLILFIVSSEIKIRYRYKITAFSGVFLMMLLFPYLHVFRTARIILGLGAWEAILYSVELVKFQPIALISNTITWITLRLPGIDIVAGIFGHKGEPIGDRFSKIILSDTGVSGYLSNNIFLVPEGTPMLYAPGYWGWWYLVFGLPGVLMGGVILGLILRVIWPLVFMSKLEVTPVLKVFALMLLFTIVSEGTIDSMIKGAIVMAGTIIFLELCISRDNFLYKKIILQLFKRADSSSK